MHVTDPGRDSEEREKPGEPELRETFCWKMGGHKPCPGLKKTQNKKNKKLTGAVKEQAKDEQKNFMYRKVAAT